MSMEYGGFIFAAFVAVIGIVIALFILYQERHGTALRRKQKHA